MRSIHLKSVYSCPADFVPADISVPDNWQLSWHQAETLKALRDSDIEVVFNTAMTGDGKSLAAYLEMLQGNQLAIGLYPTNALAKDQEEQIKSYIELFQPDNEPRVNRLSGPLLEIYAENEGLRKGSAITSRSGQSEVLITNPDIFHYLHRSAYITHNDAPDKLWNRIDKDFDLFIFDEFHVYQAPQVTSILNTMLLIRATNRQKKFLFLSATPDTELLNRLDSIGLRCRVISPIEAGKYQFPDTPAAEEALIQAEWRQVARQVGFNFVPLETTSKASETWLKENQEVILSMFLSAPGSRGAVILNSIAAVKRLIPIFRAAFAREGLVVRENTGLSGQQEKENSLEADLVIGTSTIDIGVDFKINFLFFESSDAGNFIQRLGRVGRHAGYQKNEKSVVFQNFRAYALVPQFFVERLFDTEDAALSERSAYDRIHFQRVIRENYRQINDFRNYYKKWGAVQSVKLLFGLSHHSIKAQYANASQQFQDDCEQVFDTSLRAVGGRIKTWREDWHQASGNQGNPIAEDAASFRGASSLLCGLYDLTEANESERFKTYELPGVLSNLNIEMWQKNRFLETLEAAAERSGKPIAKGRFRHCLGFMKLRGYREERLNWKFIYASELQEVADSWKVQVIAGLQVWQPDNPWSDSVNKKLKEKALVCYVLRKPVQEVRMRLRLPMHFQIYPVSDATNIHDAIAPYSIAFGQSALLIDTLAHRFKAEGGEIWIA